MEQKKQQIKQYFIFIAALLSGIAFDQFTKYLAVEHLKDQDPFVIIKGVFQLRYLENRGAAFGMMQNQQLFFVICASFIVLVLFYWYGKTPFIKRMIPIRFCVILLCAGAIGNMIDRVLHEYVVDFFYFELIDFPIFNVADIYVVAASFLFVFLIFFYYKEDEFDDILLKKHNTSK